MTGFGYCTVRDNPGFRLRRPCGGLAWFSECGGLCEGKRMFEGLEHEAISRKMFAMVPGYRTELSKLRSTFYLYPMEQIVEDKIGSHRTFKLFVNAETERDREVQQFAEATTRLGYGSKVWVTPGLPMLVFILISLGLTITFGDVILGTVMILAGR